jgi:hypothetical protein
VIVLKVVAEEPPKCPDPERGSGWQRPGPTRQDLELEGGSRSEAGAERGDEGEEDCLHEGSKLPHRSGSKRESLALARAPRNTCDGSHFGILGTNRVAVSRMLTERGQWCTVARAQSWARSGCL